MPTSPRIRSASNWRRRRTVWYALGLALLVGGPAWALGMPNQVRIPIVRAHGPGDPPDAALFSHWEHDSYTCVSCHPSAFPQRKVGFTHEDMAAGRFCGSCHNGRTAFAPKDKGVGCETCHAATSKKPAIDENDLWK